MSFDIVMGKRYIAISCLMLLFLVACGENGDKSVSPDDEPVSVGNGSSSSSVKSNSSSSTMITNVFRDGSFYDDDNNTLTDLRDGHIYKTITIDSVTWMAENLNYAYTSGSYNYHGRFTSNFISWCYDEAYDNCSEYGRLYTWAAAMDSVGERTTNGKGCGYGKTCSPTYPVRGVCPKGWHLPNNSEWKTLFTAVGGSSTAGNVLKSQSGWKSRGNGTDTVGFSALPAGYRDYAGNFYDVGVYAHFWSSTDYVDHDAILMSLYFAHEYASLGSHYKGHGYSVRCVKD